MDKSQYPLQWPMSRKRTPAHIKKGDPFNMPSGKILSDLARELKLMGSGSDYVISSNLAVRRDGLPYAGQAMPEDSGVALYFKRKGQEICITCDQYKNLYANLRAIGKTIEAIRGIERWGTEEMMDAAFTGFAALPAAIITEPPKDRVKREWWQVLGVAATADAPTVKQAYRRAQSLTHPDAGGSDQDFQEVQAAYEEWRAL